MIDGFYIGPLYIHFYGIILMTGALAGGWLASREAKRRGHDPEIIWDLMIYLIIAGVVGARLWHVFTPSPSALVMDPVTGKMVNPYFAGGTIHIIDILNVRSGGLGIPGAVIGGAIALYFYSRKHQLDFLEWADIAAPSLALGQAIGRWGNFFNQELYGRPTNLPWAVTIDPLHRLPDYADFSTFHPAFLYESLWSLLTFGVLLWLYRRRGERLLSGELLALYLVAYAVGRSLLELVRLDSRAVPFLGLETGLAVATLVSLLVALVAIVAVVVRRARRRRLSGG